MAGDPTPNDKQAPAYIFCLLMIFAGLYLEDPLFSLQKNAEMALPDTNYPHFFYDDIASA